MTPDEDGGMSEDAALSALLRDTLRARTPEGLSETQRAEVLAAARERRPALRGFARKVALLAIACGLPLAVYLGGGEGERAAPPRADIEQPARADQEAARAAEAERAAELKATLREHSAEEDARGAAAARAAAAPAPAERRAALPARGAEDAKRRASAAAGAADSRAAAAAAASGELDAGARRYARKGAKGAAVKAGAARKSAPTGACDPNDALCGL